MMTCHLDGLADSNGVVDVPRVNTYFVAKYPIPPLLLVVDEQIPTMSSFDTIDDDPFRFGHSSRPTTTTAR